MYHRRQAVSPKFFKVLFGFSLGAALLCESGGAFASASSDLKRMFGRIDRQLCHAFDVHRCHKRKQTRVRKSKPLDTKEPTAPVSPSAPVAPEKPAAEAKPAAPVAAPAVVPEKPNTVSPKIKLPEGPVPMPRLRPDNLVPKQEVAVPPVVAPAPVPEPKKAAPVIPKPVPKPEPSPVVPVPPPVVPVVPPVTPPVPHPMVDGTLTGDACYSELQKLGANFERLSTAVSSGACSVSDPVKLTAISRDGTVVKFPDGPTLTCGFAVRFVNWVTQEAAPVVQTGLSAKIATMGTGPGYQCRGRNGDSSAKLSEHAFGNAVDIERFKLSNGEVVDVSHAIDMSSKYQPVLAGLRSTGCQYFMTVLGPGANSAHASHFHFDLERRGKKGNNKMCE